MLRVSVPYIGLCTRVTSHARRLAVRFQTHKINKLFCLDSYDRICIRTVNNTCRLLSEVASRSGPTKYNTMRERKPGTMFVQIPCVERYAAINRYNICGNCIE